MVALALLPLVLLLFLTACGEEEEVAEDPVQVPEVSPTALPELPEGVEEATLTISDGTFDIDEIRGQEDEPTILYVVNEDDTAYRFQIVEELLTATPIEANATTDIEFTSPDPGRFEGQLLPAEGDEVLDTVDVVVTGPGGTLQGS